jgi:hypothetical protein
MNEENLQAENFKEWLSDLVITPEFEKHIATILHKKHKLRWRLLTAWIFIFTMVCIYLIASNRNTLHNVQAGRVASCKKTYESIRQVFKPFAVPVKKRTERQRIQSNTFNNTINSLKRQCVFQTHVKQPKPPRKGKT